MTQTNGVFNDVTLSNITFSAPSSVVIYRFKEDSLIKIAADILPQVPVFYEVFQPSLCISQTMIIVGTRTVALPGQPSIYKDNSAQAPLNGKDNLNERLYVFNGKELKLVFARALMGGPYGWDPKGRFLATTQSNTRVGTGVAGSFILNYVKHIKKLICETPVATSNLDPFGIERFSPANSFRIAISANGRKLALGGAFSTVVNNIFLYEIL